MELTITGKKENLLLSRTELSGKISFTGATPSNDALKKAVAENLKVDPETVVVKRIITDFGMSSGRFEAFVYASREALNKIEPKIKPKKAKEAAKPAEKK